MKIFLIGILIVLFSSEVFATEGCMVAEKEVGSKQVQLTMYGELKHIQSISLVSDHIYTVNANKYCKNKENLKQEKFTYNLDKIKVRQLNGVNHYSYQDWAPDWVKSIVVMSLAINMPDGKAIYNAKSTF